MFDWKKPTVQMLGRWQPWHTGHQELFKRAIKKQVKLSSKSGMYMVPQAVMAKMITPSIGMRFVKIFLMDSF